VRLGITLREEERCLWLLPASYRPGPAQSSFGAEGPEVGWHALANTTSANRSMDDERVRTVNGFKTSFKNYEHGLLQWFLSVTNNKKGWSYCYR
jgi:hypothetical protein